MTQFDDILNPKPNFDDPADPFPKEEGSLTGHSLTEARLCSVQAVFQYLSIESETTLKAVEEEFLLHRLKRRKADKKLFKLILEDVASGQERYEKMVSENLNETWRYDRLGFSEKALLLCSIAELFVNPNVPSKVVINEYVNLSKGFIGEKESGFINAVVNNLAAKVRPEGGIEAKPLPPKAEFQEFSEEEIEE